MKTYDEITSQVLEGAAVRTVKLKRIRYTCTATVVCAACVIGGAAFMKLEKPEFKPSDSYIETSDSLHSASDPSTDEQIETTTAETTAPPETTEAPTTTAEPTTEITTYTSISAEAIANPITIPVPVYVESGPAPIVTSLPGETHAGLQTTHKTTSSHKTTETTTVKTETTKAPETDPVETTVLTELLPVATEVPTDVIEQPTEALPEETTETETTEEPTTETPDVPELPTDDLWQLLYDLYYNGELPFTFGDPDDIEETDSTDSLFPIPEETTNT